MRRNATTSQKLTRSLQNQTDRSSAFFKAHTWGINIHQPCKANQAFTQCWESTQSSRHRLDETSPSGNPQRTKQQAKDVHQLANPRHANGARPGLEHCSQRFSLRPLPSLPSRTQGLVRPGPMEPDTNKR